MCKKVSCKACGKSTWVGCGKHIEAALAGVEDGARCSNWKRGYAFPCGSSGEAGKEQRLWQLNRETCLPVGESAK